MSSKRNMRRKNCEQNRHYLSLTDARLALAALLRRGQGAGQIAYPCRFCTAYHLGHATARTLHRRVGRLRRKDFL